jgi:hypothetical protein
MEKKPRKKKGAKALDMANHEIVVLAAYLAGAQFRYTDTEDIAVKANEIAPGRFSWRKYKDQINIESVRKRLWDAAKPEKGGYLIGSELGGWLVTEAGRRYAEANLTRLEWWDVSKSRLSRREQTWVVRERARMIGEAAYKKLRLGAGKDITPTEAERFFRVDDYVVGDARRAKIERARNTLSNDPELSAAIDEISKLVREK